MSKKDIRKCQFSKCSLLHDTTDVNIDVAVKDGRLYYHPDCYKIKTTVAKTKEYFVENINPLLTMQQQTSLYTVLYDLIFKKNQDPDYLYYCVWYMHTYRPGKLNFPAGLYYVIQNRDIITAWNKLKLRKQKDEQEKEKVLEPMQFDATETFHYEIQKTKGFTDILG